MLDLFRQLRTYLGMPQKLDVAVQQSPVNALPGGMATFADKRLDAGKAQDREDDGKQNRDANRGKGSPPQVRFYLVLRGAPPAARAGRR